MNTAQFEAIRSRATLAHCNESYQSFFFFFLVLWRISSSPVTYLTGSLQRKKLVNLDLTKRVIDMVETKLTDYKVGENRVREINKKGKVSIYVHFYVIF